MEKRTFDLNISERYVPKWGAWEVGREVISNAIDADRLGYKVETPTSSRLRVTTKTRPTLSQIKFIGGGTKDSTTGTIGCFGEGIKLAAMVAARLGGAMRISFDQYEISYELRLDEDLGCRSILMHVEVATSFLDGMVVDVELEGIAREVSGKFLKSADPGMFEKSDPDVMRIYNKGVFVAEKPTPSLYDWNLCSAVNRDRNVIDFWDVGSSVASLLDAHITVDIASKLMYCPAEMFEVDCVKKHKYRFGRTSAQAFLDAFKRKHGTDVVMASNDIDANRLARRMGKNVALIEETFRDIIRTIPSDERVLSVDEVVRHSDRLNVDNTKSYDVSDLERLVEILEIPVEIFVFEAGSGAELGVAEFQEGKRRVYMNGALWAPGRRSEKFGTFVHELAHVNVKAMDGEFEFEDELTRLSGILARHLLDGALAK